MEINPVKMRNGFSCLLSSSKFPGQFFSSSKCWAFLEGKREKEKAKSIFSLAGSTAHRAWDVKVRLCSFLALVW